MFKDDLQKIFGKRPFEELDVEVKTDETKEEPKDTVSEE